MIKKLSLLGVLCGICFLSMNAQRRHSEKFEQLEYELPDPNRYRNAAGAPGPEYWQNTADYVMEIKLDDEKRFITGKETITYTNNSPDALKYLWLQLDQNVRSKDSDTYKTRTSVMRPQMNYNGIKNLMEQEFEGGHNIEYVKDTAGKAMTYTINKTMMVVDLPQPLKTGESVSFSIAWNYNINDRMKDGGRSGYEAFDDGNAVYTIAQFFPRMCVYTDYTGWQNKQFLGSGEFTLPFGDYKVSITVPSDHILGATGKLQNADEVLTKTQQARFEEATNTFDKPVMIVNQAEATEVEKGRASDTKTWVFHAEDVRDFGFATSRKFIWDAMAVDINGKTVMAHSLYPKEGNPLWEEFSTKAVAHTLKVYSRYTFDYPYHKAISVHADRIGMEYPMICFNFGRPNADGTYSDWVKWGMIGVIIHEVGHNFFPMIVNSDERQWTWMDEGLNTFVETLAEMEWSDDFPARAGEPKNITNYMRLPQETLSPIMTNSEQVQKLGPNAYTKPATALMILRNTIMGPELFDRAFKEYSQRWMFKHPTPSDFFRTMEDASGVDLDWFWKGWFYGVDPVDIAIETVTPYQMNAMSREEFVAQRNAEKEAEKAVEEVETGKKKKKKKKGKEVEAVVEETVEEVTDGIQMESFKAVMTPKQKETLGEVNFYEVKLKNLGGLVMPVILEFTYEDGTTEMVRIPAEIWRYNDQEVSKVFPTQKPVQSIVLDPNNETADIDTSNNVWPKESAKSRLQKFKEQADQ